VHQPRLGHVLRHADTHVMDAQRRKISDHQGIEFADAALGARPVNIHARPQLRGVTGSR